MNITGTLPRLLHRPHIHPPHLQLQNHAVLVLGHQAARAATELHLLQDGEPPQGVDGAVKAAAQGST